MSSRGLNIQSELLQFKLPDHFTVHKDPEVLEQLPNAGVAEPSAIYEVNLNAGERGQTNLRLIGPLFLPTLSAEPVLPALLGVNKPSDRGAPVHLGAGDINGKFTPNPIKEVSVGQHCTWHYVSDEQAYVNNETGERLLANDILQIMEKLNPEELQKLFEAVVPENQRSHSSSESSDWPTQIMRWIEVHPAARLLIVRGQLNAEKYNIYEIFRRENIEKVLQTLSTYGITHADGQWHFDAVHFQREVLDKLEGLDENKLALAAVFCGMTYDVANNGPETLHNKAALGTWLVSQIVSPEQLAILVRVLEKLFPESQNLKELSHALMLLSPYDQWNANYIEFYLSEMIGIADFDLSEEITLQKKSEDEDPVTYPLSYFLRALLVIPAKNLIGYDESNQQQNPQSDFDRAAFVAKMRMLNKFIGGYGVRYKHPYASHFAAYIHERFADLFSLANSADRINP